MFELKKRLIGATLLLVLAALLVSGAVGIWVFHQREIDGARENLRELLVLMDEQSTITNPEDVTAQFAQAAPGKRLTMISPDGVVQTDTQGDPAEMENHEERAEVRDALRLGWGEAIRSSETVGGKMLYVAKRFADGMVGRAAMPVSSINSIVWGSLRGFLIAVAVALVLALILARRMAKLVLRPLNAVNATLQGVLEGTPERSMLAQYDHDDEVRPLLRSIDKLMERLESHIRSIRSERDKVTLILDCMDEGLLLLDQEGSILAINSSARRLLGAKEGANANRILLLTRSHRLREALETVRTGHEAVVVDMEDPSFGGKNLRMYLSPVSDRQFAGKRVGCSILISDVTELKQAEKIRSEFTANVSHELKTPLTSIKGFTDMLATGMVAGEEDQRRFLTMISVEVDRLIDLINDILKISELESVAIEQCEETSRPLEAAQAVRDMLARNAEEAGVTLSVQGTDALVRIPAGRLKELFLNLMENAIKYNEPGGNVDVTVTGGERNVCISVADTGIGIPEEAQSRVFERFYRVDKGRARKNGGTGLGLAIVKHITQLYSGTLDLKSTLGKGSTFTITLPAAD